MKLASHLLFARSAPASPSHMAGSFTPDSLSREGSPVPETGMETEVSQASTQVVLQQGQLQHAHPSLADLRFSQSAPGSPSGVLLCVLCGVDHSCH